MMKYVVMLAAFLMLPLVTQAQQNQQNNRIIEFPDVPGFVTLKCDFHMHTVFSDGSVWPNIRVQEAIRDGLDAISITDHIEYQPHDEDIPHPDRNRPYELTREEAADRDLMVIHGSEITRDMPPGHANAIFLEDSNALIMEDSVAVFYEAKRQNAFVFWNHPHWTSQKPDGVATLTDLHRRLISEDLLHGIEVVNAVTYSDEALQIALDHDLTMLGTSDVHGLIDWSFNVPQGGHRPVTLVFARERTSAGLKEALMAGRTAVWHNNTLIGKEEYVLPLIQESLMPRQAMYGEDTSVLVVMIENVSDVDFILKNKSDYGLHLNADVITIGPHQTKRLAVKTVERKESIELVFEVLNAVTAPNMHPDLVLNISIR